MGQNYALILLTHRTKVYHHWLWKIVEISKKIKTHVIEPLQNHFAPLFYFISLESFDRTVTIKNLNWFHWTARMLTCRVSKPTEPKRATRWMPCGRTAVLTAHAHSLYWGTEFFIRLLTCTGLLLSRKLINKPVFKMTQWLTLGPTLRAGMGPPVWLLIIYYHKSNLII